MEKVDFHKKKTQESSICYLLFKSKLVKIINLVKIYFGFLENAKSKYNNKLTEWRVCNVTELMLCSQSQHLAYQYYSGPRNLQL